MGAYEELLKHYREISILGEASGALSWDQEVMMPAKGIEQRADQLELMATIIHEKSTNAQLGELLTAVDVNALDDDARADVAIMRHDFDQATRLPAELAGQLAALGSRAQSIWAQARAEKDFAAFAPVLGEMIALKREEADAIKTDGQSRYDALLGQFERGFSTTDVKAAFDEIRDPLRALSAEIAERPQPEPIDGVFDTDAQLTLARGLASNFGYNFETGRLDLSAHPFSTGTMDDTRITTRVDEADPWNCIYSTIHEVGHSVYEGSLPRAWRYRPIGQHASLGIHESQSRFFENQIGRSHAYIGILAGKMREAFGREFDADTLYRKINRAERGFIRTEADEVHYNLHVILGFELEQALIADDLQVGDLEAAWNDAMKRDFGLDVPSPDLGVLQDVHWSFGAFGYFPTYSLGNINAANLDVAMRAAIPNRDDMVAAGDNGAWISWLNENVHANGRRYQGRDLIERITGEAPKASHLIDYLRSKFGALYDL